MLTNITFNYLMFNYWWFNYLLFIEVEHRKEYRKNENIDPEKFRMSQKVKFNDISQTIYCVSFSNRCFRKVPVLSVLLWTDAFKMRDSFKAFTDQIACTQNH